LPLNFSFLAPPFRLKFPARFADEVGRRGGLAMLSNLLENPNCSALVEDLPVGIYSVDQDRRIRFWNRGVERITGYLSHEVVGHQLEDAVQICDRSQESKPSADGKCGSEDGPKRQ
jgi:PAS domain-containing protein